MLETVLSHLKREVFKMLFEKSAFSNFSGLKKVFKKLHFRDGSVWTAGLSVELNKVAFLDFSGIMWTLLWSL